MNGINIDELLEILPKLIRENDRVKGAIISALSGVVATHEDIVQLTKEMDKRFETMQQTMDQRFEKMDQRFEKMDQRFEKMDKRFEKMDQRFETMQQTMDQRFEKMDKRFETMQQTMDQRFEKMDKRFETMQQTMDQRFEKMDQRFEKMDKRFETMLQTMDQRFEKVDQRFDRISIILQNIQQSLGKPFEQFGRNVIIKILKSEGYEKLTLESKKMKDPESFVSEDTTEVEIDGFSIEPPIIVEITSVLRTEKKIDTFLKKKEYVEKEYGIEFRGFFVAATSEFSPDKMADITVKLREANCELINL
jgi:hypothetical protein